MIEEFTATADTVECSIAANYVATFEKVSYDRFREDIQEQCNGVLEEDLIKQMYADIQTPRRATRHSAGYDFASPFGFSLEPGESICIPTGFRTWMLTGWALMVVPRSSLGFKYRVQLDNTIGIIDRDYYYADNEGHIFIRLTNDSKTGKRIDVNKGDRIAQGIFIVYGLAYGGTEGDEDRHGGIGSTGK